MRRRRGFSLGELFFAMGIIIIGGGVIMANCQRGYRSARAASCSSNVKQLALCLRMYCTDWDVPPRDPRDFGALNAYAKNTQIFRCPAQRTPGAKTSVPIPGSPDTTTDYLLNPQMRLDDPPGVVAVGDDVPNRHMGRYWIGARVDGACFVWPANEWQSRLGGVSTYAPPPGP